MKCKNPWLYFGVILGFLSGFSYFAYGVSVHGSRAHSYGPITVPGTTIRN